MSGTVSIEALWTTLRSLQQNLLDQVRDHEQLCRAAMTLCRWRVARAGRVRMEHLHGRVFPVLHEAGPLSGALLRLVEETPAYRQSISSYVSRWTTDAILADWPAYQDASREFRGTIRARVADEVRLIAPLFEAARTSETA